MQHIWEWLVYTLRIISRQYFKTLVYIIIFYINCVKKKETPQNIVSVLLIQTCFYLQRILYNIVYAL